MLTLTDSAVSAATAAEVLEDKALDAQVNEQGDLAFRISDQADES